MENSAINAEAAELLKSAIASLTDNVRFDNVELEMISIAVGAGTTTYTKQHTTAMRHKRIIGIALNITDEAVLEGSTMSMSIDSKEVFPAGTEAKLLFASTAVPPNQKFYTYVDREINQTTIDVSFTSNSYSGAYNVNFYLLCQNES
ncbi:MAG: hypothetical protein WCK09_15330 [Bacteroidota bacterium]